MQSKIYRSGLVRSPLTAIGFSLLFAASSVAADPPILPLQGPGVTGQLLIPAFVLGINVDQLGTHRLTGPAESTGTSELVLGVFGTPEPFLITTVESGVNRFTRSNATLAFELAVVPPVELECEFPDFSIPGLECPIEVIALPAGRVQTKGGVILVGDPLPIFIAEASWSLHDDQGVEIFSDGIQVPLTTDGGINDVFSDSALLMLKANHAYRVTMRIDAQARATTLPVSATALVGSVFVFPPGTPSGYSIRVSNGVGNTRADPVPEPDFFALLGSGAIAIGLRRRARLNAAPQGAH